MAILEAAGTSKYYRGLYESAEKANKLDAALLDALEVEWKETADVPALADAMVDIEHCHDHLKQIAANGWLPLPEHPDLAPAHEALLLREHLTELPRTAEVGWQPVRFRELLKENERSAQALEDGYRAWEAGRFLEGRKALDTAFASITRCCTSCHQEFRDVPLREKGKR